MPNVPFLEHTQPGAKVLMEIIATTWEMKIRNPMAIDHYAHAAAVPSPRMQSA
jgi:hypothetical protein